MYIEPNMLGYDEDIWKSDNFVSESAQHTTGKWKINTH